MILFGSRAQALPPQTISEQACHMGVPILWGKIRFNGVERRKKALGSEVIERSDPLSNNWMTDTNRNHSRTGKTKPNLDLNPEAQSRCKRNGNFGLVMRNTYASLSGGENRTITTSQEWPNTRYLSDIKLRCVWGWAAQHVPWCPHGNKAAKKNPLISPEHLC